MSGTGFRTCTVGTWRAVLEGPAAEEAERRLDELKRGLKDEPPAEFEAAVYGCTADDPEPHFLGVARRGRPG